jgi:hypothetical protein
VSGCSAASAQTPASERVRERSRVSDAHRRSPQSRAVANAGTCLARMRQCGRRSSAPVSWTPTTSKHARAESSSVLRASETAGPPVESSHDHANAQLHAHGATGSQLGAAGRPPGYIQQREDTVRVGIATSVLANWRLAASGSNLKATVHGDSTGRRPGSCLRVNANVQVHLSRRLRASASSPLRNSA